MRSRDDGNQLLGHSVGEVLVPIVGAIVVEGKDGYPVLWVTWWKIRSAVVVHARVGRGIRFQLIGPGQDEGDRKPEQNEDRDETSRCHRKTKEVKRVSGAGRDPVSDHDIDCGDLNNLPTPKL